MKNLDYKVFGRDSIFIEDEGLGFFKKLKRKVKKIKSLAARVAFPKQVRKLASKLETKHRKKLKLAGAVAAVATGAFLAGPAVLAAVGGKAGGAAIAKGAAAAVGKTAMGVVVSSQISKKMSGYEQRAFEAELATMSPDEVLADERVRDIGVGVARSMQKSGIQRVLASEGAFEIGHQAQKSQAKRNMIIGAVAVAGVGVIAVAMRAGSKK